MEQRISVLTLSVADLARSRAFYEDGLGWRAAFADDEVAFYQLNGLVLALFSRQAFEEDADLPTGTARAGGIALAYNVRERDEVDSVLAQAAGAGARMLRPARDTTWGGYSGYFADPDGHPWEVAWNPHWRLDDAGNLALPA